MNQYLHFVLACCIGIFVFNPANAQHPPPFFREIQQFKKQDSIQFPPADAILLVGSSSFTRWTDVNEYFPQHRIINRGFGGSSLPDVIRYANDIIFPYMPAQIVVYCGENDLAASDTVTAQMVFNRFDSLFQMIRKEMPGVPFAFVSLKPSPSRERLWPKMEAVNEMVKEYLGVQENAVFIDVYHSMFNGEGNVMKDIFGQDNLHMNAKGYAIWQRIMAPYLLGPHAKE